MERARKMILVPEETFARMQDSRGAAAAQKILPSTTTVLPQQVKSNNGESSTTTIANSNSSSSNDHDHDDDDSQQHTMQTPGDNLSRLDAEMYRIVNKQSYASEQEKSKHYLQVLRRYLFFKDKDRLDDRDTAHDFDEIQAALHSPLSEESILESIPKVHNEKARRLLKYWQNSDRLKWDSDGTIILDGKRIRQSNIKELLNDVFNKKKRKTNEPLEDAPVGRFEFANFIRESETPQELILNPHVIRIVKRFATPATAKRKRTHSENSVPPLPPSPMSVGPSSPQRTPSPVASPPVTNQLKTLSVTKHKRKIRKNTTLSTPLAERPAKTRAMVKKWMKL